jgi:hypothetical protein
LTFKLVDLLGLTVASTTRTLEPGNHMAAYVSGQGQLFPAVTSFRGSLQVLADSPVPAVALRTSSQTLTTLPPVLINQPYEPTLRHFPQVVVGGSYRSSLLLVNPGYFTAKGTVSFTRSDGGPLVVTIGARTSSLHEFSIPPHGSVFLESSPIGAAQSGYAVVSADHGVDGVLVFSQYDPSSGALMTEAGVPSSGFYQDFLIFAQAEGEFTTGLAVANVSASSSELTYALRSSSDPTRVTERGPDPLPPRAHLAALVSGSGQLFPSFSGTGTLEVHASAAVPAITLRLTSRTLTSLPVVPLP